MTSFIFSTMGPFGRFVIKTNFYTSFHSDIQRSIDFLWSEGACKIDPPLSLSKNPYNHSMPIWNPLTFCGSQTKFGPMGPHIKSVGTQNCLLNLSTILKFKPYKYFLMHVYPTIHLRPKRCLILLTPCIQYIHLAHEDKLSFYEVPFWAMSKFAFLLKCQTTTGGLVCNWISCTRLCFMTHHFGSV